MSEEGRLGRFVVSLKGKEGCIGLLKDGGTIFFLIYIRKKN